MGNIAKNTLLVLLMLPFNSFAQQNVSAKNNTKAYSCIITSDKKNYLYGEVPKIIVAIKNNSNKPICLVNALDGSDVKWRFPHAYFAIAKVKDTTYQTKIYARCRNTNEITAKDFVELKPDSTFNPYKIHFPYRPDNIYAFDYKIMDTSNFSAPGKYLISFYYSTNEIDFSKWTGGFSSKFGVGVYENMLKLFANVPKIEISSNVLEIDVN